MLAGPRLLVYRKTWLLISGSGVRNPDGAQVRGYFTLEGAHTSVLNGVELAGDSANHPLAPLVTSPD